MFISQKRAKITSLPFGSYVSYWSNWEDSKSIKAKSKAGNNLQFMKLLHITKSLCIAFSTLTLTSAKTKLLVQNRFDGLIGVSLSI